MVCRAWKYGARIRLPAPEASAGSPYCIGASTSDLLPLPVSSTRSGSEHEDNDAKMGRVAEKKTPCLYLETMESSKSEDDVFYRGGFGRGYPPDFLSLVSYTRDRTSSLIFLLSDIFTNPKI